MRRVLLALMIVLLPLRGWLGDAMAMDLVRPAVQAVLASTAPSAPPAHHATAEAPVHADHGAPPCHEAEQAPVTEHAPPQAHDPADHGSGHGHCTACQICHSVAVADSQSAPAAGSLRHAAPQAPAPRFASAELRLLSKPPIS